MSHIPPGNINKRRPSKVQFFDGMWGDRNEVLFRSNARGWDISNTVANEVYDFDLSKSGVAALREGKRKIVNTGKSGSIDGLFFVNIAGALLYGRISGGILDLITIPQLIARGNAPIDLTPTASITAVADIVPLSDPTEDA